MDKKVLHPMSKQIHPNQRALRDLAARISPRQFGINADDMILGDGMSEEERAALVARHELLQPIHEAHMQLNNITQAVRSALDFDVEDPEWRKICLARIAQLLRKSADEFEHLSKT